ncbi:MAG: uL13 family ribosomal protein [Minisyncoccia bacterium]
MTDMKGNKVPSTYTIDAAGRSLGRVASEAAHALMGKRSAQFVKNQAAPVTVVIENAKRLAISERRAKGKIYTTYSGYPGGQYAASMKDIIEKKGVAEVLRKTIDGMIPRNKLRTPRMKNLMIKD